MRFLSKFGSLVSFLLRGGPEQTVGKHWLFRTHTRLFKRFMLEHRIEIERRDDFTYMYVDGKPFVWPAKANVDALEHLLSELLTRNHPHQYEYGPTIIGSGDVVLDIGCCEGGFAAHAAEAGATVIAVEPSEQMGGVIKRLFEIRGLPEPEIRRCLLGARSGAAWFLDNMQDPTRSKISDREIPGSDLLPLITLDELIPTLSTRPT
ncbi:MAG TPA: methyltransferase domain-containing protein, partial [Chthoniobacteraceae bacterium]|nr:methyltransferase domain-containing protein [Chthoniobacteraceae bacterium]